MLTCFYLFTLSFSFMVRNYTGIHLWSCIHLQCPIHKTNILQEEQIWLPNSNKIFLCTSCRCHKQDKLRLWEFHRFLRREHLIEFLVNLSRWSTFIGKVMLAWESIPIERRDWIFNFSDTGNDRNISASWQGIKRLKTLDAFLREGSLSKAMVWW